MADTRKRSVVSFEKLDQKPELKAAFEARYPNGFSDYLNDLM